MMTTNFSRRQFLGTAATAVVAGGLASSMPVFAEESVQAGSGTWQPLNKAILVTWDMLNEKYCEHLRNVGYEGMELWHWDTTVGEARKTRQMVEQHGLRIHAIVRGWLTTNSLDKDKVEADIQSAEKALRTAAAHGASSVLLVTATLPGGSVPMPDPWDFEIDFDPKTLHVKTVVAGDNTPYADYIKAQNFATECSVRALEERLIPVAAKEGVTIALENVWNNLWCTPEYFAAFVRFCDNPWVKAHFDLGNHTKYSRCEEWLKALGSSIVKLDLKDYAVKEIKGKRGGGPGDWAPISKGTVHWKNVRKGLEEIGYRGWISVEETVPGVLTDEEYIKFIDDHFGA